MPRFHRKEPIHTPADRRRRRANGGPGGPTSGRMKQYNVSEQMRRIADGLFELIDASQEEQPEFALECLREARTLAATAIKGSRGAVRAAGAAVMSALESQQQRLLDAKTRLREPKNVTPHPVPRTLTVPDPPEEEQHAN